MKRFLLYTTALFIAAPAQAQFATITTTPPVGDNSTRIASTAFLSTGANLSAAIDAAFGSTRGSILERGASGWQIIAPGTTALPFVSNGAAADPAYQVLTNAGFANMAAKTVKSNNTAGSAAPSDNTSLPNPFSVGTSLYPVLTGFEFDTNSAFGANTLGAKTLMVGVPAATSTCCTWLNTYLSGVDSVGIPINYSIHPGGTSALWTTVTAARSSDSSSVSVQNIIPQNCVEVHDNTTVGHQNWCGYDAAYITATAASGRTLGREISVFNTGTASTFEDPFTANPTTPSSEALRVDCAAGGGFGGNDCGTGFYIVNNGAKFKSGFICGNAALSVALTANPDCIALPPTWSQSWYSAAGLGNRIWQLVFAGGTNGNLNLTTGGTGAFAVTALNETTGQAWSTYTPTLSCSSGTLTTSSATGRSRQLGKTIFYQINITITTVGTCANNLIATLPFTAAAFNYTAAGRESTVSGAMVQGLISASGSSIAMTGFDNSTGNTTSGGTGHVAMLANGATFTISGVYERN